MGRLERHLDLDLIARMEAGTIFEPEPMRRQKVPRAANTYRGARRNAARGLVWKGVKAKEPMFPPRIHLNRSAKWRPIAQYKDGPGRGIPPRRAA